MKSSYIENLYFKKRTDHLRNYKIRRTLTAISVKNKKKNKKTSQ